MLYACTNAVTLSVGRKSRSDVGTTGSSPSSASRGAEAMPGVALRTMPDSAKSSRP
jgi:hypothetical protein